MMLLHSNVDIVKINILHFSLPKRKVKLQPTRYIKKWQNTNR